MAPEDIDKKAREALQHLENAAGDMAFDTFGQGGFDLLTREQRMLVRGWKEQGITDLVGAFADHLYCDHDFIRDICGDRVYDLCNGVDLDKIAVWERMAEMTHNDALKSVAAKYVAEEKEWLAKHGA